jgi:hypothetical protein
MRVFECDPQDLCDCETCQAKDGDDRACTYDDACEKCLACLEADEAEAEMHSYALWAIGA